MSGTVTIESTVKYFKDFIEQLYIKSAYAVNLVKGADIKFDPKAGKIVLAEPVEDGVVDEYATATGYTLPTNSSAAINLEEYSADFDLQYVRRADAVDVKGLETITSRNGVIELFKQYLNKFLSKYFDMACTARIASEAIANGATPIYGVDFATNGLAELVKIQKQLTANEVDDNWDVHVYVNSDAYFELVKDIIAKNGLANDALLSREVIADGDGEGLKVSTKIVRFGNLLIHNVPKDRMYDKIIFDSTTGKFVPDIAGGAKMLTALVIPDGTAFAGMKWFAFKLYLSSMQYAELESAGEIDELNNALKELIGSMDGVSIDEVLVANADILQAADANQINNREIFDVHAIKSLADRIIPVYADQAPTTTTTSTSTSVGQ